MRIIDAHIHADFDSAWLQSIGRYAEVDFSPQGLRTEMEATGVIRCISMGIRSRGMGMDPDAPTPYDAPDDVHMEGVLYIGGVNPYRSGPDSLEATREALVSGKIVGLKIYLGYFPFHAHDAVYREYYGLADAAGVPVVLHTGDTESPDARIKYAHPLEVDEVAVEYRRVRFIVAHMGNPWMMDAAEVVAKNENVYADLSGLVSGREGFRDDLSGDIGRIREAADWIGGCDKLLYGSDWPLAPMSEYIEFIKSVFPDAEDQNKVFCRNAEKVFFDRSN
jgi:predicted TIM-barrel fold metal-dependent hydrolase